MQTQPLIITSKKVSRLYLTLDKPFNMCIIDYKWSNTEMGWVVDKMIWNDLSNTYFKNTLRDGKFLLGIL